MTGRRLFLGLSTAACALAMGSAVAAQNIVGAIDFHVHQGPDSVKRQADADDVARRAKAAGMRGLVMKNHWESTASSPTWSARSCRASRCSAASP